MSMIPDFSPETIEAFRKKTMEMNPPGMSSDTAMRNGTGKRIPRWKPNVGDKLLMLHPLSLSLPFNPFDLDDDTKSTTNRVVIPGSVEMAILMLRDAMRKNPELLNRMMEVTGKTKEEVCPDDDAISYAREFAVYGRMRRISRTLDDVQRLQFSVYTQSNKQGLGRTVHIEVKRDPETGEVVDGDMGYRLYCFETDLIAGRVKAIDESYTNGADKNRSAKEHDDARKDVWKHRLLSNPFKEAFSRALIFKCDNALIVDKESSDKFNGSQIVKPFEYTLKVGISTIDSLETYIGTERFDRNLNFFAYSGSTEQKKNDGNSQGGPILTTWSVCGDNIQWLKSMPNLAVRYNEFLATEEAWDPAVMHRSVFDFQKVTEDSIKDNFRTDLSIYGAELRNTNIIKQYSGLIAEIDSSTSDQLLTSMVEGTLADGVMASSEDRERANRQMPDLPDGDGDETGVIPDDVEALLNARIPQSDAAPDATNATGEFQTTP